MRLRQGIRPVHFQRVLRGQDQERQLQLVFDPGDRDRLLLHRFEQGRLRLGRGPIDLIGEDDVAEDGPLLKLKIAVPFLILRHHAGASDIGRHEVRGKLNAREIQMQRSP